jgi:hypothetical protein
MDNTVFNTMSRALICSTGDAAVKFDCSICQDKFSEDKIEKRGCGHMTCRDCDTEWRRRGSIVYVTKRQTKKFHIASTCPMCRAVETYENYKSRSKESLAEELSVALGMLYRRNVYKLQTIDVQGRIPINQHQPRPVQEMDDLSRQAIQQLLAEGDIMPPPIITPRAVPPVVTPQVAPVVLTPRPVLAREPVHNYGLVTRPRVVRPTICANREYGCYTNKTKLKCPRCNIALCRDCKNRCPCNNP